MDLLAPMVPLLQTVMAGGRLEASGLGVRGSGCKRLGGRRTGLTTSSGFSFQFFLCGEDVIVLIVLCFFFHLQHFEAYFHMKIKFSLYEWIKREKEFEMLWCDSLLSFVFCPKSFFEMYWFTKHLFLLVSLILSVGRQNQLMCQSSDMQTLKAHITAELTLSMSCNISHEKICYFRSVYLCWEKVTAWWTFLQFSECQFCF